MEYFTLSKRSHLVISSLLIGLFSLLVGVVLFANYFIQLRVYDEVLYQYSQLDRQQYARNAVDNVIRDIESDFVYCGDITQRDDQGKESSFSEICQKTVLEEMVIRRIARMNFSDNLHLRVKKVLHYNGGKDYAVEIIDTNSLEREDKYLSTTDDKKSASYANTLELAGLQDNGLYEWQTEVGAQDSDKLFHYSRLYKRLDWIVEAEINLSSNVAAVIESAKIHKEELVSNSVRNTSLFLFFLGGAICISWGMYRRLSMASGAAFRKDTEEKNTLQFNIQKREQELEEKEKFLQQCKNNLTAIFRAADNVGFIISGFKGGIVVVDDVSPGVEKMLGFKGSDLVGKDFSLLHPAEFAEEMRRMVSEIRCSGKLFSGETVLVTKDGDRVPVLYSCQPRYDKDGNCDGIITAAVDISKLYETRKALHISEERLQQALKLEAIGTLAGGIAHDFNNVLSSIVGYSELVKEQLPAGSEARNDIEQILHASSRAASLVKQILAFSRNNTMENSYFEPALIIKETLKMLRSTIPVTIEIQNTIHAEGELIYANNTQFHQVFMNLCTNAFQSMEAGGGVLRVNLDKVDNTDHVPDHIKIYGDEFLELVVSDTGCGIPVEIKEKVFEPFFSTKESAKGTGMGLNTVYTIVTKIGGAIWFNDRVGGGTEFHVLLPAAKEKRKQGRQEIGNGPVPLGSECILLIDDEADITRMAKTMLEGLGYSVHCYNNAVEALEYFLENKKMFDLIITDQTMPEITGAELAQKIREHSSDIPIILCTGYSARISEENWMRHGINAFIMKPFRKAEIARLIRETLDAEKK